MVELNVLIRRTGQCAEERGERGYKALAMVSSSLSLMVVWVSDSASNPEKSKQCSTPALNMSVRKIT